MYLEIALVALSLAILGVVIMFIPFVVQFNRFIRGLSTALDEINRELPRILKNIDEISTNLRNSSFLLHRRIEALDAGLVKIQSLLGLFMDLAAIARPFLKLPALRFFVTARAVLKGVRVFSTVLRGKK